MRKLGAGWSLFSVLWKGVTIMQQYLVYVLLLPFWVLCVQFSFRAISMKGTEKQNECKVLGIVFTTIGIVSLVSRDVVFVVSGLVLIMIGLRMMAISLDRIDKKTFIDLPPQ
jgi:hypothetical protein